MNQAVQTKSEQQHAFAAINPIGGWFITACVVVIVIALTLRLGTNIVGSPATFDEPWIIVPIADILEQGWSKRTAIDFDETKGPGLIWPYAIAGRWLGGTLDDLRLFSMVLFIAAAIPLLDMARRCGVRGPGLIVAALLYALLPYHAPLGQLLMSEPSFVACSIAACWLFVRAESGASARVRLLCIVVFAFVVSIALHNRVHAAAIVAGTCIASFQRGGIRGAWPWIVAGGIAGLSRIPLLIYWGGIVSPRFQGLHALGVRPEGLTYLFAALTLPLAVLIPVALSRSGSKSSKWFVIGGGAMGLVLAALASPDLQLTVVSADVVQSMYSGVVATAVKTTTANAALQSICIGICSIAGGMGFGALLSIAFKHRVGTTISLVHQLQFWTLFAGIGMSALSAAPQYDRYPLAWLILMPIVWSACLPRWALLIQSAALIVVFSWLSWRWLM